MNDKMNSNYSFNKHRIQTPKENIFPIKTNIISDKKAKSTKKFNINDKKNNQILFNNNINSINIINNNYNNIYLETNKQRQNKNILLEEKKNLGLLTFGNGKEKSIKKNKGLKLIFNNSNREKDKFNENKYQYIIDRLKYEIDYYKNKSKGKSNNVMTNSPKSYRKKGPNKNLFLASNKYNTIKAYNSNTSTETNRKNKNPLSNTFNSKLTSDFSYKNNLKLNTNINNDININQVIKSNSNNLITINSNRNKRQKNNSDDIIYESDFNGSDKSSYTNVHNYKLHLKSKMTSPLSLKKNVININHIFKGNDDSNYRDKFDKLKNRMNNLIGNLFDIIELQQNQLKENNINNK